MTHLEKKEDFEKLTNKGTVLVDFYADWCGPCQMLGPVLEKVEKEEKDLTVVKVNVDEFEDLAREYKIMVIPAIKLFKDGKIVKESTGYLDEEEVKDFLK